MCHVNLRMAITKAQQQVLKDLVEAYPGFIVAGGGTGSNPVRGRFGAILAGAECRSAAQQLIEYIEGISARLAKHFPTRFPATKETVRHDVEWMKEQLGRME